MKLFVLEETRVPEQQDKAAVRAASLFREKPGLTAASVGQAFQPDLYILFCFAVRLESLTHLARSSGWKA